MLFLKLCLNPSRLLLPFMWCSPLPLKLNLTCFLLCVSDALYLRLSSPRHDSCRGLWEARIDLQLLLCGQPHRRCLCNGFFTRAVRADEDPALSATLCRQAPAGSAKPLLPPPLCHFHWTLSLIQYDCVFSYGDS